MTSYYDKKPFKRMSEETFLDLVESKMRWDRERISNGFYVIQQINDKQRKRKNTPHDDNYDKGDEENNSLILWLLFLCVLLHILTLWYLVHL